MTSVPLVSVVMPTHNYGRYVGDAVEAILRQSFEALELLVVDDASTDETSDILDGVSDPRLRVIRRRESACSGVAARNDGMRAARGALIAVADADDVSLPGRLEEQVSLLRSEPDVDFVGCGVHAVMDDGRPIGHPRIKRRLARPEQYRQALLKGETPLLHQTMMFRKRVLKRLDGYGPFLSSGDTEFLIRASRHYRFDNIERVLVHARKHGGSVTAVSGRKLKRAHRRLFLEREAVWVRRELERLDATR